MTRLLLLLLTFSAVSAEDVLTVDPAGSVIVGGSTPPSPSGTKVHVGGGEVKAGGTVTAGDVVINRTTPASGGQAVRGAEKGAANGVAGLDGSGKVPAAQLPAISTAFYGMISDQSLVPVGTTSTATINRMHVVSGSTGSPNPGEYTITLPSASANAGGVVGFVVKDYDAAPLQYKLDTGGSAKIAGRTQYLILVHTNVALLLSDGTDWLPLVLNLDTPWVPVGDGTVPISAITQNPTPGTTSENKAYWRRSAENVVLKYSYEATTGGTNGNGKYLLALPTGMNANPNLQKWNTGAEANDAGRSTVGIIHGSNNGGDMIQGSVRMHDNHYMHCTYFGDGGFNFMSSTSGMRLGGTNIRFTIHAEIPILNW